MRDATHVVLLEKCFGIFDSKRPNRRLDSQKIMYKIDNMYILYRLQVTRKVNKLLMIAFTTKVGGHSIVRTSMDGQIL